MRWDRRAWSTHVAVTALLAAYVALLYLAAVLARRALLDVAPGAGPAFTVLAAAVAAVTLEPVRNRVRRRLPVLPQARLARLARGAVAADDLPEMLRSTAQLVQEGLGAASVQITTAGTSTPRRRRLAAGRRPRRERGRRTRRRSRGPASLLGSLRVAMPAGSGVSPGTGPSWGTSPDTSRPSCRQQSCATPYGRPWPRRSCAPATCGRRGSDSCWPRSRAAGGSSATSTTVPSSTSSHSPCTWRCSGPSWRTDRRSGAHGRRNGPHGGPVRPRRRRGAVPRPVPGTSRRPRARRSPRAGRPRRPSAGHGARAGRAAAWIPTPRPPSTSAVWRRCRTRSSTPARPGSTSASRSGTAPSRSRCPTTAPASCPSPAPAPGCRTCGTGWKRSRALWPWCPPPGTGTAVSGEVPLRGRPLGRLLPSPRSAPPSSAGG